MMVVVVRYFITGDVSGNKQTLSHAQDTSVGDVGLRFELLLVLEPSVARKHCV